MNIGNLFSSYLLAVFLGFLTKNCIICSRQYFVFFSSSFLKKLTSINGDRGSVFLHILDGGLKA